jgi:hypothetical protein
MRIGITEASALRRPVAVSMGETACASDWGLRGRMRHLSEPSLKPELIGFYFQPHALMAVKLILQSGGAPQKMQ